MMTKRQSRHKRVRAKIKGTKERPRLSVFKSNKYIYAQLIDDVDGKVFAAVSNRKGEATGELGKLLAKKATDKGIKLAVFDRGGYKFHGKVLELAKGAREGGLKF
ncbi:50S ribosomal protein L18 [Candidatus Azambacteria bacterium RIFOXYC1_FULL_41_20]|nr:MAG: 50S ribosomal protein L18 [Candidatus Azambacteria bacterium GW2011_GWB1_42_72]OGD41415.1 MAG: 50S ribosomal protein L18 [Candidatus Azambacteria bacterium RIFOXYB1_FULL_40_33]OGD42272.1 MAG: 50S ribosomal protein L18 [Candidatus Azambacteria bacterium RIFCSPLOWO2_02_FULL_42_10]OGD42784.1 MAG: 50S ribosomal protein L18 [Candidatus Azambacteria bacterium RIFOXYA1_FULL_42_37]OGD43897.1 MAG: 50S ribosomal protein L18 [Candidatus Azambacteria bacterium RIFOXYC1_FULL_41_20]OGD47690.1 MAG: 5